MAGKAEQIDTSSKKEGKDEKLAEEDVPKEEVFDLLEDDDDFEEFEDNAPGEAMDEDMGVDEKLWRQDWDDEEADEDFVAQLRGQLAKTK